MGQKMGRWLPALLPLACLLLALNAAAHGEYLFNVSFDHDPELKGHAIKNAQIFLNTTEEPVSMDLDSGLVSVNFRVENGERQRFVLIAPSSYSVQGFYDESLVHPSGRENSSGEQRKKIAESIPNTFPESIRSQLEYSGEEKNGKVYSQKWARKVNGVLVLGDTLEVLVDGANGNVAGWRLAMFDFESVSTVPKISLSEAIDSARRENSNDRLYEKFPPYLVLTDDGRLAWLFMLYNSVVKNYYVAADADTGEIVISGTDLEEIPASYQPAELPKSPNTFIIALIAAVLVALLALIYKTNARWKK